MDFNILILGAGIAGLSCAKTIAENGIASVALVANKTIGAHDPSPLTFSEVIKEHRLQDCVKETYSRFTYHNYQGSSVTHLFPDEPLVVLDYKKACKTLFAALQQRIEFIDQTAVDLKINNDRIKIRFDNGSSITTKFLIDASGTSQFVAHKLNRLKQPSYFSHVYGALFSHVLNPEQKECCFLLPNSSFGTGGGWFYSIHNDYASFGYAHITNSPKSDINTMKRCFNAAMKNFTPYSDYLRNAKPEQIETGIIPISYIDTFIDTNIVIIGDAAGMATNWACMGVEPALTYSKYAGEILAKIIGKKGDGNLNSLQKTWDDNHKKSYDTMLKLTPQFWNSDHYTWEWIIKNDLAKLSPQQLLNRLRRNDHLLTKSRIFKRALSFKIHTLLNKNHLAPTELSIR